MGEKEFNLIVASRIKHYMKEYEITQDDLAKRLGVSQAAVNNWCTGRKSPRMGKVDAMCEIFHCRRSDLINDASQSIPNYAQKIKVLGKVAAGTPIEMIEDVAYYEVLPIDKEGDYFGLIIKGDSMEPRIMDGDVVIVKQQPMVENGQIGIVAVNGEDATCKRVYKYAESLVLMSDNPKYPPREFTKEEVQNLPVTILGRVVELMAKF